MNVPPPTRGPHTENSAPLEDKIYSFEEAFNANTESVISSGDLLINLILYALTLGKVIGKSSPNILLQVAAETRYKADLAVSPVESLIVRYNSPCPNEEPFHQSSSLYDRVYSVPIFGTELNLGKSPFLLDVTVGMSPPTGADLLEQYKQCIFVHKNG